MTDVATLQSRIAKYGDQRREYWNVKTADREFLLFLCPPQDQETVMAMYPGAGVTKGEKP